MIKKKLEGYGTFIRKHRLASGFKKQKDLADATGISAATISRIENELNKPEPATLKTLSKYLTTTSYVELMVACGYWDESELLDEEEFREDPEEKKEKNEEEFLAKIDLSNEELLKLFQLQIDGKNLTEEETKGIIAYIRSLRAMKN